MPDNKKMTQYKGRLLLVDDECDVLFFLEGLLTRKDYQVLTALSGQEALDTLQNNQFDIMITDIRMPGIDGIELIEKAAQLQPAMQSMVSTGHGDIDIAINALKLGTVNYFPKPINMDELLLGLDRCMEKLYLSNELKESKKRLIEANRTLEDKVKQRTDELMEYLSELRLLAEVFENSSDSIVITDKDGTIIRVNPGFSKLTGYTPEEVIGQNPRILKSGHHDQDFYKNLWESLLSKGEWNGDIWNRKKNGEIIPEWLHIKRITNEATMEKCYVAIARDMS